MIQSMTGFGTADRNGVRVDIRSLNHRFLDISMRLSPLLSEHEIKLRNILKSRFSRGKIDVTVSVANDRRVKLRLNSQLAKELYQSLDRLKAELSIPGSIGIDTLMNYKELFIAEEQEIDEAFLLDAFNEAVAQLEKARLDEGEAMAEDISKRLGYLYSTKKVLFDLCPDIVYASKAKFHQRLTELMEGVEFDRERMLQEVALLAEKTDISEEMTRIENHLVQFEKILQGGDTIGKRLDFLLQELNREVNTIASKTGDHRVSNIAIDMRSEIEKMREQVQNIQ